METLRRDKKTLTDALASVQDKIEQAETKKAKLQVEIDRLADREEEVSLGPWLDSSVYRVEELTISDKRESGEAIVRPRGSQE